MSHPSSTRTGAPALGTLSGLALCTSSSGCSPLPFILSCLGFPGSSGGKESTCNAGDPFDSWVRKIHWRRDRLPTPVFLGFPCGSTGKESACNMGDVGSVSELGRSPEEGKSYPLQYSGLENSMDCIVHGVIKSWT